MIILSDVELDHVCTAALSAISKNDVELYSIVFVLYNTGLRVSEVLNTTGWREYSLTEYEVYLSKTDGYRVINKSAVHPYIAYFYSNGLPATFHTYRSVVYSLSKVLPRIVAADGTNVRLAHLFRYNHIRRLKASGLSISEVALKINHKNLQTTKSYLHSPLLVQA